MCFPAILWPMRAVHRAYWRARDQRTSQRYCEAMGERKLHLGCGDHLMRGWLNTDLYPLPRARPDAIELDAGKPFLFADGMFDYVYAEHMIEHMPRACALAMLRECYRVLKPGGVIRLATPDFNFLVRLYREPDEATRRYVEWSYRTFIGEGAPNSVVVVNNFVRDWGHLFIYDSATLKETMAGIGFRVTQCAIGQSQHRQLIGLENAETRIPAEFYAMETFILEGMKPI